VYYPSRKVFKEKIGKGVIVPVYKEVLADLETPVSAYSKIKGNGFSFLFESVTGGEKLGRYSFLGSDPRLIFKATRNTVEIIERDHRRKVVESPCPLDELKKIMDCHRGIPSKGLPRFYGGAVGYISYDFVRSLEEIPDKNPDDIGLPDFLFGITDTILIFDHIAHTIKIVSNASLDKRSEDEIYDEAVERIEEMVEKLKSPHNLREIEKKRPEFELKIESNFKEEEFEKKVLQAKEYIRAGDILQVVLSQRLRVETESPSFLIYRVLRHLNPSPYMYYIEYGEDKIIGSSPEILVRVEDGLGEVRPIAGTRPRGATDAQDNKLSQELLNDPKECAEHIMLVDLGRNDLGRVCEVGSVKIQHLMEIEKYSHVMHVVSSVVGRISPGRDHFDVLKACFPAGTVTGAPKIRAMEIIDELEPTRRGPYAGCVGYFSFSGNLDCCITIRTILVKGKTAYIQVGAGIVADSVPKKEYRETMNKARALLSAIRIAEGEIRG
jgi:anthranilate synthase component 1